jgi:Zn finger protein HypA/HybF involved in hydrogenase expression
VGSSPTGATKVAAVAAYQELEVGAMSFSCMECGHKFKTVKAAERAAFGSHGCPKCGSSDVDLSTPKPPPTPMPGPGRLVADDWK